MRCAQSGSTTPNYVVVSRNQVVEHWDPQSDHHADNAAVQASGIEKSVVGKTTFDREYPTFVRTVTSRAFCNSPVHEQWSVVASRRSFGRAMFASTDNHYVIALCCSAVYIDFVGVYTIQPHQRSIQQSNRQVPMKQFVMFQRLLPSLCQSVSASG
jgi:hypothetical protein